MMKRTEKSKPNSKQKSTAINRQDKSRANRKQGKPKDYDRDKAEYEEEENKAAAIHPDSQPVPKHLRTSADVQKEQDEVIMTIPKIDFNQTAQKQRHRKSRRS